MPFGGSIASPFGTCPSTVYFFHPETNYYEYGEVQNIILESHTIRVKDLTGSVFVVPMSATAVVGRWTAGMELYYIHPLGSVEKVYVAEDAKGNDMTIKISKNSFVKTVTLDQLKWSPNHMQQLLSMGDAGKCFFLYNL